LIKEAAMLPVRELTSEQLSELKDKNDLRPLSLIDFQNARKAIAPSVSEATIEEFMAW
jgi:SpoVK/Ycf46/Vps4 family AAA+-type ATPase